MNPKRQLTGLAFLLWIFVASHGVGEPLRILTWNVGLLRVLGYDIVPEVGPRLKGIPQVLSQAATAGPLDLICLQEVWEPSQSDAIERALAPLGFTVASPRVSSWLGLSSGLLVAVRAPTKISALSFSPLVANLGWEGWASKGLLQASLTTSSGREVEVFVFHLGAVSLKDGQPTDSGQIAVYRKQVQQLASLVRLSAGATIVLGDANTGPLEGEVLFEELKTTSGLREVGPLPITTWDPANPLVARGVFPNDPPAMIDHIFLAGADWSEDGYTTLERFEGQWEDRVLSDHYGLTAAVDLSAQKEPAQPSGGEVQTDDDHDGEVRSMSQQ